MKQKRKLRQFFAGLLAIVICLGMMPGKEARANVDVTAPVIESVVFHQKGMTIKEGESLTFTLKAYDTESDIETVCILVESESIGLGDVAQFELVGENEYRVTYSDIGLLGELSVTEIEVVDAAQNSTVLKLEGMDFVIQEKDYTTEIEGELILEESEVTLSEEDYVGTSDKYNYQKDVPMKLVLKGDYSDTFNRAEVSSAESQVGVYLYLNNEKSTAEETVFEGVVPFNELSSDSVEKYTKAYLFGEVENAVIDVPEQILEFKRAFSDTKEPELLSVSIDKQAEVVKDGAVTVTVELKDDTGIHEEFENYIMIRHELADVANEQRDYPLVHQGNGIYTATIDTSDLYPTEWHVCTVSAWDSVGNQMYESIQWGHYFDVTRDGTYVQPVVKDMEIHVFNPDFETVKVYRKDVTRRTTIAEVLDEDLLTGSSAKYGKFLGWSNDIGSAVMGKDDNFLPGDYGLPNSIILFEVYEKSTPDVEEPSEPDVNEPSEPDVNEPSEPEVEKPSESGKVELDEKVVDDLKEEIAEAAKDQSSTTPVVVKVDMKKEDGKVATVVPKEVLEAAKGENVEVVLDMGDYQWTIKGQDIKASDLESINLEVSLDTKAIPTKLVEELAEGKETYQISLTHNGEFGFKADLTINLGKENAGQYGNLYYYDSNGKLVFMNAGKIDENGNVDLSFSHASDYVVVIEGKEVSDDSAEKAPLTGDASQMFLAAGWMMVALLGIVLLSKSRLKVK